jgi:hypothetical protein
MVGTKKRVKYILTHLVGPPAKPKHARQKDGRVTKESKNARKAQPPTGAVPYRVMGEAPRNLVYRHPIVSALRKCKMPILRPGVAAPVSRAAAACCGSPVRVAVHRIDDSYNRFDYNRADVAPILEEVELAEAIDIDETRSFERHLQRTALSPPRLLITCAQPRRIRFGSQIGHPPHVVKLVNFDKFVPPTRGYARAYEGRKAGNFTNFTSRRRPHGGNFRNRRSPRCICLPSFGRVLLFWLSCLH